MDYKVSIFKDVRDTSNPFNKSVFYALDRIKTGKSKKTNLEIRSKETKEEQNLIKKSLPGVCFNGTFFNRSIKGLNKKSGLIILDFDGLKTFEDTVKFKEEICKDKYVFSSWISPSGKGIKVLIKIPIIGDHKGYFDALEKHFNSEFWDKSSSNVDRFCFESFDETLFLNIDSFQWTESEEPEICDIGVQEPLLPIKSDNRIISNLIKWWDKKYGMQPGQKNNNLFKLAAALNTFGISKNEASNVLLQYDEGGKEKEIILLLNSAYKNNHEFGTRFFEDSPMKRKIEKQIRTGKKTKDILNTFPEYSEKELEKCVVGIKENISIDDFWNYDQEGKCKLSPHQYKFWLQQNNFYKYFPTNSNTYTFIRKDQNLIEETNEKRIKDFVLNVLLQREDIGFMPYDMMASTTKYFTSEFLSCLESAEIEIQEDTIDKAYLYYKNYALEVTKDNIKQIDYIDIKGFVWKKQLIDRDFEIKNCEDAVFAKFLNLIAGKDESKYNSFKSVIGYLMHSFKTSANNKAIIFNDETISENPNGGSGKGIFWNALAKMKKVSSIDGKTFEFTKSFPYQTVSTDCQILVFDDVKKNFNFESLFSLITEGITLEYKNQDAIKLPVNKSPKILITTNYTIGGVGGSFERRKFEVEMSDYFSFKHTPIDEFGHMLFDEWNSEEWLKFDNFMIECCQYYLENGLVKHNFNNLDIRKFIKETSYEFYEWSNDGNLPFNIRLFKDELHDQFIKDYTDYHKLSKKKFTQWLTTFSIFYNHKIFEGKTNNVRWIEYEGTQEKVAEEKPLPPQVIGNRLVKNEVEEVNEWDSLNTKVL